MVSVTETVSKTVDIFEQGNFETNTYTYLWYTVVYTSTCVLVFWWYQVVFLFSAFLFVFGFDS